MTTPAQSEPPVRVERYGSVAVLTPSPAAVALPEQLLEQTGASILAPLEAMELDGIVMDLSQVEYFGSLFISFLMRCYKLAKQRGGRMVLAGATGPIQQLLRLSALDNLWPFHPDRAEAVRALASADGKGTD